MDSQKKAGIMPNLVRRVVTKKRSRTLVEGPAPLASSSFRGPKRGLMGMQRERPPTQIEPELMEMQIRKPPEGVIRAGKFPIKGMKARMYFPDKSHERDSRRSMYEEYASDTITGVYGASMPSHSYYSQSRSQQPVNIHWTPPAGNESAPSAYSTPTQRDQREMDVSHYQRYLEQLEAKEMNMIQADVKDFQQARRKLIMDKYFYEMKGSSRQRF